MILGVGIDMIEVERVAEKIRKDNGFMESIFSEDEISYCESQKEKAQHYASRFTAKEAFLKATGRGLTLGYNLKDIEVIHESEGKPVLRLTGSFKEQAIQMSWNKIHISLSHVQAMACAVVIIED